MDKKDKPAGAGFWGTPELLNRYSNDTPGQSKKVKLKKEDRDMKSAKEFLNDIIEEIVNEDLLNEENNPTDPAKWAASISAAKSKFDVYPSAYANAWASKHYKAAGGEWESTNEEVDLDEALKVSKNDGPFTVVAIKGGKVVDTFRGAEHGEINDVVAFVKSNNKGAKISVEAKGGRIVHTESFDLDEAKMIKVEVDPKKKIGYEVKSVGPGGKTTVTKRRDMPDTDDVGEAFDSKKSAEEIRIRTKYRMSKDGGKDGKPYSPEDMHNAMDSLQRKKARTSGVRRKGSQHPDNTNLNLKIGEAMGPGIAHKDGLKDAQKTDSMQRYYAQVKKDQVARAKQIEQERKDGIRSKYESVERVDELKKSTLMSYKIKAQNDKNDIARANQSNRGPLVGTDRTDFRKRVKGIDGATRRLVARQYQPEDVEQVDELNRDTLGSYANKAQGDIEGIKNVLNAKGNKGPVSAKHRADLERELENRTKGRRLSIRKKYTEDVEQVDELDTKTLKSYIKNAQRDNTQRVTRMADKPDHMPVDKDEMDKLRKRQTGVVKAKNRKSMGEEVEQVDELKMPEKSKRGRATDPVIAAALKRGWKRADLKADGKLRRGDAEGAESHMTNARKRKIASRVESVDLDEKLQIKLKSKFKPSSGGSDVNKIFDVIIDGVRVGIMTKETSDDHNYGDGGSYMSFKILQPGSRNKYAEEIHVDDVEDPNDFFKQLKKDPRTAKRTIKALKAHGVELTNINSKHESVDLDELKSSTLRSYADKAAKDNQNRVIRQIANDPAPTPKKSMDKLRSRSASQQAALSRLDARSRLRGNVDKTPEERKLTKRLAREGVENKDVTPKTRTPKAERAHRRTLRDLHNDFIKTNNRAKNVVKAKRRVGEDVEQIDELSPKTLKKYIWLAKGQVQSDLNTGNHSPKTNNRAKNVVKAMRRVGEDVERIDELSTDTLRSYVAQSKQNTDPNKRRSRMDGVSGALSRLDARSRINRKDDKTPEERAISKRLASEDVERIDELSPDTLKSYATKARKQVVDNLSRIDGNHSEADLRKRAKGLLKAKGKLGEAKVGDTVHIGHASKGGTGVKGKVVKIDGNKVHIKNDKGDMFKGSMDRVTVGEAIKFDAGHPDSGISGTVSGKGKRNRKAGGEVRVKYKGHPAYRDDSPGLPINAREIGRLIRTARKKDTKPHDSKNLTNPAVTRDPNGAGVRGGGVRKVRTEGVGNIIKRAYGAAKKVTSKFDKALDKKTGPFIDRMDKKFNSPATTKLGKLGQRLFNSVEYTDEGMTDSAKRAAKILTSGTPKNVHNPGNPKKSSVGDQEARRRERNREFMLNNREGVEDMTAAQERDAQRRLKPTRATVAKVGLPSTKGERDKYVKDYADEKGGNPKLRRFRDLMLKGKRNNEEVEEDSGIFEGRFETHPFVHTNPHTGEKVRGQLKSMLHRDPKTGEKTFTTGKKDITTRNISIRSVN